MAVGLLVALMQYVFNEGASRIALSQAFIGVSDVWVLAPWMILGVMSIAVLTSLVTLRRYLRVRPRWIVAGCRPLSPRVASFVGARPTVTPRLGRT